MERKVCKGHSEGLYWRTHEHNSSTPISQTPECRVLTGGGAESVLFIAKKIFGARVIRNCQTIHFHLWHHCDKNARVVFSAAASESCRPNWPSVNAQLIVIKWNSDHIHFNQKRWSASYWDVQFQNRIPLRLETNIPLTAQVHKGFHERGRDCDACGSRKKKKKAHLKSRN